MEDFSLLQDINELCDIIEETEISANEAKRKAELFLQSGATTQEKKIFLKAFIESFSAEEK